MSLNISSIIRKNIISMQAYSSARSLAQDGHVFLDANEAPDDQISIGAEIGLNRYPPPQPLELQGSLANFYGVNPNQICMCRGSDEAIDLLVRMVCEPGKDAILTCPPTYGMYAVAAEVQGAGHIEVSMRLLDGRFELDREGITTQLTRSDVKLLFICRPNNPTGEMPDLTDIESFAQLTRNKALVVVDEAYIEFTAAESATRLLDSYSNIIVLRTFSKAWGLAGVRFGVAIAAPEMIEIFSKVRAPYPISSPVRSLVNAHLTDHGIERMLTRASNIAARREHLRETLLSLSSVEVIYPSVTNYLLVKVPQRAEALCQYLRKQGIFVRDRSRQLLLEDCLRITIGNEHDHQELLKFWRMWETTNA